MADIDLSEVPEHIRQKVSIISAHFLLQPGATIADMGCGRGHGSYVLAMLNPRIKVIGIDTDKKAIRFAREHFDLPNLTFQVGDAFRPDAFADDSLDGILNSNILSRSYSAKHFNHHRIAESLSRQISKLKIGGKMVISDYAMPPLTEYVLLELPDEPSKGPRIKELSDVELLVEYSRTARPMAKRGCEGFFLEELPRRNDDSRLFRLPRKWALEFVLRKDYRDDWENELDHEYGYFTQDEFQRDLEVLGMRTLYLSPYWNPWIVANRFNEQFHMYTEEGALLGPPPTNYFVVAQRMGDESSLMLEERRPSQNAVSELQVQTMRDERTGKLFDIIRSPENYTDVVPYRITQEGQLVIYARHGFPRPLVNAVSRGSPNLDGKKWSGHLIEPMQIEKSQFGEVQKDNLDALREYLKKIAHLDISREDSLFRGPAYYPAPDFLELVIEPVFIEVDEPLSGAWTTQAGDIGSVREFDARDILRASQVGLLPEARLEIHVNTLMEHLGIDPPPWVGEKIEIHEGKPHKRVDEPEEIMDEFEDVSFVEETKDKEKTHKVMRSVFVDDGLVDGAPAGLAAAEMEFVISAKENTQNIAVIVPMTRDLDGEALLGLEPQYMPVPQRLGGDGKVLGMPSFPLPRSIRTIDQAKEHLAEILGVSKYSIGRLGESYYSYIGLTTQRVFPFIVATSGSAKERGWIYAPLKRLKGLYDSFDVSGDVLKLHARSHQLLGGDSDLSVSYELSTLKADDNATPSDRTLVTEDTSTTLAQATESSISNLSAQFPVSPEGIALGMDLSQTDVDTIRANRAGQERIQQQSNRPKPKPGGGGKP